MKRRAKLAALLALALVAASVFSVLTLLYTPWGRGRLLAFALSATNDAIPGRVEAKSLSALTPSALELSGLELFDPAHERVLAIDRVRVEFSIKDLVSGRIVLPRLALSGGHVDLRQLRSQRRGLLAALVAPAPPSGEPPPYVRIDAVELSDCDVQLPSLPELGGLELKELVVVGSFEFDRDPRMVLQRLSTRIERGRELLGGLKSSQVRLSPRGSPSSAQLRLSLLGAEAKVAARLVLPPSEKWKVSDLELSADITGVTAARLAKLLHRPALARVFKGSVAASLMAHGQPQALQVRAWLRTEAGELQLAGTAKKFRKLEVNLRTKSLLLSQLLPQAPKGKLALGWKLTADVGDTKRVPVRVDLSTTNFNDHELPKVHAEGVVLPEGVEALSVNARDAHSSLSTTGKIGFSGRMDLQLLADLRAESFSRFAALTDQPRVLRRGRIRAKLDFDTKDLENLHLRGTLNATNLRFTDFGVESLNVDMNLAGAAPFVQGRIEAQARGLLAGETRSKSFDLVVEGGPDSYHTRLAVEAAGVSATADLSAQPTEQAVTLSGSAQASYDNTPFRVAIRPTTVRYAGSLSTQGVKVSVGRQALRIEGDYAPHASNLALDVERLDLEKLGRALGRDLPAKGTLSLEGRARGSAERPELSLRLQVSDLQLNAQRPKLNAVVQGHLDAQAGNFELLAELESGQALKASVAAASRFDESGTWLEAFRDGNHELTVELDRLETGFLQAWLPEAQVPVSGSLSARVRAQGTLQRPTLRSEISGKFDLVGTRGALQLDQELSYEDGRAEVSLKLEDEKGQLADGYGSLEVPGESPPSVFDLPERLRTAARDGNWRVSTRLEQRKLADFPFPIRLANMPPAVAQLAFELRHQPGLEPTGSLRASLRQIGPSPLADCKDPNVGLSLSARLAEGRLRADLSGRSRGQSLLRVLGEAPIRLLPALDGSPPEFGALRATLRSTELELERLPLVCGRLRGTLTATARLIDPLGTKPEVLARVKARKLTLGAAQSVDVTLDASADRRHAKASAELVAGNRRSTFHFELPLSWQKGSISVEGRAPVRGRLRLRRLPLAPFFNPRGAISYASGNVSGDVTLVGTVAKPKLQGSVDLEDIGLTATDWAQPLRNINGHIDFTERKLVARDITAQDRDGTLKLDGELELQGLRKFDAAFSIAAKEFPLRQQGDVVATMDAKARVAVQSDPKHTQVRLELSDVDTWLEGVQARQGIDLSAHPDIVVDAEAHPQAASSLVSEKPAQKQQAPGQAADMSESQPRVTELSLVATDRFWVKRDDFAVKLSAELNARIEGDDVRVKGQATIDRGYLDLFGKVFDIERGGQLEFIGSPSPDPVIQIEATHVNRRSGDRVKVQISGRSSKPVLTFFVNDEKTTAGEAFLAIYGGQKSNQAADAADGQAKRFVGGLTAGLLAASARRELGAAAPILMIEPGEQSNEGRVRAGFELDSLIPGWLRSVVTGAYFEGIVESEHQDREQSSTNVKGGALIELYFPNSLYTAGQYGPGTLWSVDFGWQW